MEKQVEKVVSEYFEEYGIKDMTDYGSSDDASYGVLGDISEIYADILIRLGYQVTAHNAEDGYGDGKYIVSIAIEGRQQPVVISYVKAWHTPEEVARDIKDVIEEIEEDK